MNKSINTKSNIRINGKDYTKDEILKNVSDFFVSTKDPKNPNAPKIPNMGFKEKMILNTVLKSLGGKNLEGFFNETLVAKIGKMESEVKKRDFSQNPQNTPIEFLTDNGHTDHGLPVDDTPIVAQVVENKKNSNLKDTYKPIQVGYQPQIVLLGVVLGAFILTLLILSFLGKI